MNLLDELVHQARETVKSGYYRTTDEIKGAPSFREAVTLGQVRHDPALIAEIKPATPTRGRLGDGNHAERMKRYIEEGACALSVLTEPKHFGGSLQLLRQGVGTHVPVLMKDFILDEKQIDCAATYGASAVLLIQSILPKNRVNDLIEYAHLSEREVLLECATRAEVERALETEADLIGINNRDLKTFDVDLERTPRLCEGLAFDRPLVSLSGFASRADVERMRNVADAVLVGTSLLEGSVSVAQLLGDSTASP